jgi:ComF family protein
MAIIKPPLARRLAHIIAQARSRLVESILPPQCLACAAAIDVNGALCPQCWHGLDFIEPPYCSTLGIPFAFDPGENILSAAAIASPPHYDHARSVAHYCGPARNLIHALKYGDRLETAPHIARWMARAGAEFLAKADLIIPVPLYRTRLWRRRYNQSAILARAIGDISGVGVDGRLLRRMRSTRSQVGLTHAQRRRNVAGAFGINSGSIKEISGTHIILVDDVITTGATVNACAGTLLKAGVKKIDVLTFGMVVDAQAMPI